MKITRSGYSVPTNPNWSLSQIITPPSQIINFGMSFGINTGVKVSGDSNYLVVSARQGQGPPNYFGTVFIYVWNAVTEEFNFQTQLFPPVSVTNDAYGISISIDDTGTRLAVSTAPSQSKVYIYSRSGTTWSLEKTITAADYPAGSSIVVGGVAGVALDGTGSTLALIVNDGSNNYTVSIVDRSGTTWTIGQSISISAGNGASFNNNGNYMLISSGEVYFRSGGVYSLQSTVNVNGNINGNGDNVISTVILPSGGPSPRENTRQVLRNYQRSGTTWTALSPDIEHPEWHGIAPIAGWDSEIAWGAIALQNDDGSEVVMPGMNVGPYPPQSGGSGGFFYTNYFVQGFGLLTRQTANATLNYNDLTRKPDYQRPTPLLGNNAPPGPNYEFTSGDMSNDGSILALANSLDNLYVSAGSSGCVYIYKK